MLPVIGSKKLECLIQTNVTAICDSHPQSMSLYFREIALISRALIIITALCAIDSYGQGPSGPLDPNAIVPPTPSAMKMTEYFAQRPNMYTGTANVSVPLYTIDFDGWKLPMSLSYNATGVRPNEEAGDVGLGWAFNFTGVVSRTIRGGDDIGQQSGYYQGYVYNDMPVTFNLGYDYMNPTVKSVPLVAPPSSYYNFLNTRNPDTQADVFNYDFFGYSGSFILTQKNAINPATGAAFGKINIFKLTKNACVITFNEIAKTFSILTPEGYKGDFTVQELSTTVSSIGGSSNPTWFNVSNGTVWGENFYDIQACINLGRFETISSWYLSQITSPRGQKITFTYDLNNGRSPYYSNSRSWGELANPTDQPIAIQTVHEHIYLKNILSDEININFSMETREDLRINRFFSQQSSNWKFRYDSLDTTKSPRHLPHPLKRYTGFNVKGVDPASTLNKQITFKQSYFNNQYQDQFIGNQSEPELLWLRSRLDRVTIDDQQYRFYYNAGIPQKLTFAIDHFGFYNGRDANTKINAPLIIPSVYTTHCDTVAPMPLVYYQQDPSRTPNFNFGKGGLLTKVRYPTRGYTIFGYEGHGYNVNTNGTFLEQYGGAAGGARVNSIKEYDYDSTLLLLTKTYQYTTVPNMAVPVVSSGQLMTPLYNRYIQLERDIYSSPPNKIVGCFQVYTSGANIAGSNSAEGKVIGYSKVYEFVKSPTESYMNSYVFVNWPNAAIPATPVVTSFPYVNGQMLDERHYNSVGNIVERKYNGGKTTRNYYHPIDSLPSIAYSSNGVLNNFNALNYVAMQHYTGVFAGPDTVLTYRGVSQTGFTDADVASGTNLAKSGKAIKTVKIVSYNKNFLQASEQDSTSTGDLIKKIYLHPGDYPSAGYSSSIFQMSKPTLNVVSPVVEEITFKNGLTVSAKGNQYFYDSTRTKFVTLTANYTYNTSLDPTRKFAGTTDGHNFTAPYELNTSFTQYDMTTGRLLEFTGRDGVPHAFVWGYYKRLLPIVHGVGTTYTPLHAAYHTDSASTNYETALRNEPTLAGTQLTTYVHNPQIGVTRMMDPVGKTTTFGYDTYGRLVVTKDNSGHVLNQNKYHFKTMPPTRTLSASVPTINFGTFYHCNVPSPVTLTLTNSGEDDLPFTITIPNGFSSTLPQGIGTLYAGSSMDIPISFTGGPATYTYTGSITISAPTRTDPNGISSIPVSANYVPAGSTKNIQLSPGSLLFPYANQTQYVTITNVGNDCLTLPGTTSLMANDPNWSASVPAVVLAPGQSTTMSVFLKTPNPTANTITINADNTAGNNVLSVDIQRISLGTPGAFTFSSFTSASSTQTFTVTNSGNASVSNTSITGTNSMFTNIVPQNFTLAPGASQTISVTYNATDFSTQSTLLSFMANTSTGVTVNVTATRTRVYQLTPVPNSVTIKPSLQTQSSYLTNTGNVPVTVNSAPVGPAGFAVTYLVYSGGTWVAVDPNSTPVTLQPSSQLQIQVTTSTSGVFSSATGQLTLFDNLSNAYTLNLVRSPTP